MLEMSWPDNYTREPIVSPSEAVVLPTFCLASDCKRFAVLRLDWERYTGASGCSICRQGEFDDPRAGAVIGSGWLVRWSVQCGAN
jgi:hypothetical protein